MIYFFKIYKVFQRRIIYTISRIDLYVDDILLAINDKVKQILQKNFDIKYMNETSYVIDIKIHKERS